MVTELVPGGPSMKGHCSEASIHVEIYLSEICNNPFMKMYFNTLHHLGSLWKSLLGCKLHLSG